MVQKDPETGRFLAGNNGGGRKKGSRNKLGEKFLSDLQSLWEEEGAQVLKDAREDKPMEFAKMIAGLLPKELLVRNAPTDEMTDEELADRLDIIEGFITELAGVGSGARPTHGGAGEA